MNFAGISKVSLVDYPKKIVSTVFTLGCNFRCDYCHNPDLIEYSDEKIEIEGSEVIKILEDKIPKIDGLCITGGEPTLWDEKLISFIKNVKNKLGANFLVKVDTNGSFPKIVEKLTKVVDFVAMDFKSLNYEKFSNINFKTISQSLEILNDSKVDYEIRITMYPGYIREEDFQKISKILKDAKKIAIQNYNPKITYKENFMEPYKKSTIGKLGKLLEKNSIVEYR